MRHNYSTFQYRIIHRALLCNEWLKNNKIKPDKNAPFVLKPML